MFQSKRGLRREKYLLDNLFVFGTIFGHMGQNKKRKDGGKSQILQLNLTYVEEGIYDHLRTPFWLIQECIFGQY